MNSIPTPAALGEAFPHKALTPKEAYPRIDLDSLRVYIDLVAAYVRLHPDSPFADAIPAPMLCVWKGPLAKYLVNQDELDDSIAAVRRLLEVSR